MIPLYKVHIPDDVDGPLLETLHSGFIGQGPKVEEFENIVIRESGNGEVVRLKDVARVELAAADYSLSAASDDIPAALIGIFLQSDANALDTAKQVQQVLDEQAARLAAEGVSAEGQTEWGEPADGIAAAASALPADLIVMATHGHTEMRHVFMGSVTEDVVRSTNIPVLLIRPRAS